MEWMFQFIQQNEYLGIFWLFFFGVFIIPIPVEGPLMFIGFLVFKHKLDLILSFPAVFLGVFSAVFLSYLIGRYFGSRLVAHYGKYFGITSEKLEKTELWFEQNGRWGLTLSLFVPGLRHLMGFLAGVSKLNWTTFLLPAAIGAFLWPMTFMTAGFLLEEEWKSYSEGVHSHFAAFLILLALFISLYLLQHLHRMKSGPAVKKFPGSQPSKPL